MFIHLPPTFYQIITKIYTNFTLNRISVTCNSKRSFYKGLFFTVRQCPKNCRSRLSKSLGLGSWGLNCYTYTLWMTVCSLPKATSSFWIKGCKPWKQENASEIIMTHLRHNIDLSDSESGEYLEIGSDNLDNAKVLRTSNLNESNRIADWV